MSKTQATPPKIEDEDLIAEIPVDALESIPVVHAMGQTPGVQGPVDFSAAAMGRHDTFTCAKRSYFGQSRVVRIMTSPLTA